MKNLNIREVRKALGHLDDLLEQEGELTITRHGEEIARLVPIDRKKRMPSHAGLRKAMPRMRQGSEKLVREDRDRR